MSEQTEEQVPAVEEIKAEESKPMSVEDGIIKVDLGQLNKLNEDADTKQKTADVVADQPTEPVQKVEEEIPQQPDAVQDAPQSIIEEITEEEIEEKVETIAEEIQQAVVEQDLGVPLPENIQKVVEFMEETGGSLEDYVKLNTDYSSLNDNQLLSDNKIRDDKFTIFTRIKSNISDNESVHYNNYFAG